MSLDRNLILVSEALLKPSRLIVAELRTLKNQVNKHLDKKKKEKKEKLRFSRYFLYPREPVYFNDRV